MNKMSKKNGNLNEKKIRIIEFEIKTLFTRRKELKL